jgi:hypothetical protein
MSSNDLIPSLVEVPKDPRMDFASKPLNVSYRIIANRLLAFSISGATDIDHMNKGIGMSQVVQELIAETLSFRCTRNKSCNV